MGQWVTWRVLLLLALVFSPCFVTSSEDLSRNRRQSDYWWWNAPRSQPETGWGTSRINVGVVGQSRQVSSQHPINVRCMEDTMVVTVQTDLYGTGKLVKASDLNLGPRLCRPSSQSTTTVIFQQLLQDCGIALQMTSNWLIYSTNLTYSPTPTRNSPIIRSNPAMVSIQCYYLRLSNVSSSAIKPTWLPFSSTISADANLSFSMKLMAGDWSAPRASPVFQLGDTFNIEVSVDTSNHIPMKVFVDRCVATLSPDISSSPKYEIIAQNGCLMDGKQDDASSAFRSPRPTPDRLQFTVDAFRFFDADDSKIYITCKLRATAQSQVPDPSNKACSFKSNIWIPLEGPADICSCCDTGACVRQRSRRLAARYPGLGRLSKKEAVTGQARKLATLGPLLVIGAERSQALAKTKASRLVEVWVVVAIVSASLVLLTVFGIVGKPSVKMPCRKPHPK